MPNDLTSCLKKAGEFLHPQDKAAILAAARELRASGKGSAEAAQAAISKQLDAVRQLMEAPAPTAKGGEPMSLDAMRVEQIAAERPDMMVMLPGAEKAQTVREALADAKQQAAHDASEADLVKAAMECALSLGA